MARLAALIRRANRRVRRYGWRRLVLAAVAVVITTALLLYFLLAYTLADSPRLIPESIQYARNIVFVTAHPDDETLFFSPTVLYHRHDPRVTRSLLVISSGNYNGIGDVRESEIHNSCAALGIALDRCMVLDHPALQDNPKAWWDEVVLRQTFEPYIKKWKADLIITFDNGGISGHINHRAVSAAVRNYVLNTPEAPQAFMLDSTFLLRKYSSLLDLVPSALPFATRIFQALLLPPPGRAAIAAGVTQYNSALIVSPWRTYLESRAAFGQHHSQYSWDRVLYLVVSRYMWFNTLERIF
ncbi:glycan biosynthesis protein [Aspergillus pseudoustus]|uniref:N-acetylglucosaminylphosphatidylinositol deacetylase n=1 Tax=Aspergillus pseudoustus TaxID=1810923 RepID=A0ABR4K1B5_9EURO